MGDGASANRIVHRFDFDERPHGNVENVPKYWEPLRPTGFPHYPFGVFDFEVGAAAPPSFHLVSEGRSVAFQYTGPETRVRVNTDYRIVGMIRPDRLRSGRACLSAYFLDQFGHPVPDTLVRSAYFGGAGAGDDWVKIDLYLASAPREAFTIGIATWVLASPEWESVPPPTGRLVKTDVRGGAWFDDIVIYALPLLELSTSSPGNVLLAGEPQEVRVVLADNEDPSIRGDLIISDADGGCVENHSVSVVLDAAVKPTSIPVDHLPPGLYHARLDVFAGKTPIESRELRFVRLAPGTRRTDSLARAFGVSIAAGGRANAETELALLDRQAARSAKIPVWAGMGDDYIEAGHRRETDRLLHELGKRGFALTGVFSGFPESGVWREAAAANPLLELFASDPKAWEARLASVVAPHAGAFRWWQIGSDEEEIDGGHDRVRAAAVNLRAVMQPFITLPRLAAPAPVDEPPASPRLPVEQMAVHVGSYADSTFLSEQFGRFRSLGYEQVSAYVAPLPKERYPRLLRLADWAQRILTVRHAGADTVFVPQTWEVRPTMAGAVAEPTELYVALRTLSEVLADATPGQRLELGPMVRCLVFHEGDKSILAMWDAEASLRGARYAAQLGQASKQVDLWGNVRPLIRDEQGRQIVELTAMPTLVPDVERWLVDFRTSLSLSPTRIEPGVDLVRHTVTMSYAGDRPVSGGMQLELPPSWQVSPRRFGFSVMPGRPWNQTVEIRYPHNEPAGRKELVARISLENDAYQLEVPLSVEIALSDLEVWGSAVVQEGHLILRQVVTNRSNQVLSFRGSATAPGRERQYRPISNLHPGDTQVVEYRVSSGTELIGRTVHLLLREVNDGPRVHNLQLVVP